MSQVFDRRSVLKASGVAAAGLAVGGAAVATASSVWAEPNDPVFTHGVASGDPLPDAGLLWARGTPTPQATPGSGQGPTVEVTWEIATDAAFANIVGSGTVTTGPDRDHTVKADATGLAPATAYHYRFRLADAVSAAGLTRTAPAAEAAVSRLRFGVGYCSTRPQAHFAAYRYLAERGDLDAVLHLGDYVYEGGGGGVRPHVPAHEILTLPDYRQRHAQYKTDENLQRLHAAVPVIATWDDHEVANDAWSDGAENHQPDTEGDYAARKAAGHQAYFEWMPVRSEADRIYRRLGVGALPGVQKLEL